MVDPTSSTPPWSLWLVMTVITVAIVRADDKVCSIGRHGLLTRFNGETVTVASPCKYRMADFTCADYRVRVTPGSSVDEAGGFNPDTVWLKVVDVNGGEEATFRTSLRRLAKYHEGEVGSAWKTTGGGLSGAEDAVSYNRSARAVTFSPVEQLRVVMLTDPPTVLLTCSADTFSSRPSPDTLCGDGTTSDTLERAALRVLGNGSDLTMQQFLHYIIMDDVTVTQSATCRDPASQFQSCPHQHEAASTCHVIFDDPSRVTCLLHSGTAPQHYYSQCLQAVCEGHASALVAMETFLRDNCSGPMVSRDQFYRIVPDTPNDDGFLMSMLLLDGGKLLQLFTDLDELRLVDMRQPNITLSSLTLEGGPAMLAQLSSNQILVSHDESRRLLLVNISGDVLKLAGEVMTEKCYVAVCPAPNNTWWGGVYTSSSSTVTVDQLDLQGRVLRTVYTDTSGRFQHLFHIRHYDDHLYLFTLTGQPGVLSLTTGQLTTTIGQTDLTTLGLTFDLLYHSDGDAYVCVVRGAAVCGGEVSCVVRVTPSGQVSALPNFFSGTEPLMTCVDLILTDGQLMVSWLVEGSTSDTRYSEITVQHL